MWRSLDLLGMKHISSANLQPFKRASALVEAKVIFYKSCSELPCGPSIMKQPETYRKIDQITVISSQVRLGLEIAMNWPFLP